MQGCSTTADKAAGLFFRQFRSYIGPRTAAAKADPAGSRPEGLGLHRMLNDIYNKRIIELAGNIPRLGRLCDPDASATAHSKLCGSTVKVDLKRSGDTVTDFAHDVKACALGQASSSIMASHVVGSTASELREFRETVRKLLKENGRPAARQMGRHRIAGAGARLQGAARLDDADLRCRGRCDRPDRSESQAA